MKRSFVPFLVMLLAVPVAGSSFPLPDFSARARATALAQSPELKDVINPKALDMAMRGYHNLLRQGLIRKEGILTLIDFDKPSDTERLYVIDIANARILHSDLVAHGRNSGMEYATMFSNASGSNMSSLGFFITEGTYHGKNGYSLALRGMDPGINDKAASRGIVIHGADYVSRGYIDQNGYLGRSFGCPALSQESYRKVIEMIKDGSCLFIYRNGKDYVSRSGVLNPGTAMRPIAAADPA